MQTPYELIQAKQRQRRHQIFENKVRNNTSKTNNYQTVQKLQLSSLPPQVRSDRQTIQHLLKEEKSRSGYGTHLITEKIPYYYLCHKNEKPRSKVVHLTAHKTTQQKSNAKRLKDNKFEHSICSQFALIRQKDNQLRSLMSQVNFRAKTIENIEQQIVSQPEKFYGVGIERKSRSLEITFDHNAMEKDKKRLPVRQKKAPHASRNFRRWKIIHSTYDKPHKMATIGTKQLNNESSRQEQHLSIDKNRLSYIRGVESDASARQSENSARNQFCTPQCTKATLLTSEKQLSGCLQDIGIIPGKCLEDQGVLTNFIKAFRTKRMPIQKYDDKIMQSIKDSIYKNSRQTSQNINQCKSRKNSGNQQNIVMNRSNEDYIKGWESGTAEIEKSSIDLYN